MELTLEQQAQIEEQREQLERKALFAVCISKAHLKMWIKRYLGIDLPDTMVCDDDVTNAATNSSPLDLIWEIYQKALDGQDEHFQRVLAYAARDSFKCVERGTLLITKRGLLPIEQVLIGDQIWSGKAWRSVTDWIHDGLKESVTIRTRNGIQLTVSPIHKVWAWEPGKKPEWKVAAQLQPDDLVCVDTSSGWGEGEIVDSEFEVGYLCGILQGDGCLTLMENYNRVILTASDPKVLKAFQDFCMKQEGRLPTNVGGKRRYDHFINSKKICGVLASYGLDNSYSWEKKVPALCMSTKSYAAGFISGLLDTDGHIAKKKNIELAITAEAMVRDVQTMLHALGVNCGRRSNTKLYQQQRHLVHILTINQNDIPALLKAGVRIDATTKANILEPNATQSNVHDSIPRSQLSRLLAELPSQKTKKSDDYKPKLNGYETISRAKAVELVQWGNRRGFLDSIQTDEWLGILKNRWVKVSEITKATADFYDLTVEEDHSYWSNGLVSHNTLSASILEVLCLFHLRRNVAHMAAIESQAQKCAGYISKYLQRPYLKEFVVGNNKREITVTRYEGPNGNILTPDEFEDLELKEQRRYEPLSHYIKIIIATLSGANSEHVSFMVLDELDLAPEGPLQEAKFIPAPGEVRGELPITFMTSSRKFAFGNVQKEMDKAQKDKDNYLQIRHWNIIDVTQRCPEKRHLPDQPKIPIYYSEHTLKAINEDDFNLLAKDEKTKYFKTDGFTGCLRNCSLFAVCRGRLATKQTGTSKMLKPIPHVSNVLKDVSVEHAKAQYLCWKPSAEGLIYPHFNYARHMLDPVSIYEKITGEEFIRKNPDGSINQVYLEFCANFTKAHLIRFMMDQGLEFYSGMDWGYTHNWSVITAAKFGNRLFVVDVIAVPGLETMQKIEMFKEKLAVLNPTVFPDPEDPASIATFRRHGVKMKKFKKDVLGGIESVRAKILPGLGKEPEIYLLANDEGCELLAQRVSQYHWKVDANQRPTDIPDDKDDDECDALRYLCENLFGTRGRLVASVAGVAPGVSYDPAFPKPASPDSPMPLMHQGLSVYQTETVQEATTDNFLEQEIRKRTSPEAQTDETRSGKKGSFVFDI